MKKNLSILFCLSFCSTVLPSALPAKTNANTKLENIVEVVKALKQNQLTETIDLDFRVLGENIVPINEDIHKSMVAIRKATEQLLNIANNKTTEITAKNFASKLLQPCYQTVVTESLKGNILTEKTLGIKNLKSDTPQKTEMLKHQTCDILNRIFVLWRLSQLLFNIPADTKIALQWPNADLTIQGWQALTQQAENEIWQSTEQVKNAKLEAEQLIAAEPKSREAVTSEQEKEIKHLRNLEQTGKSIGDAYTKNLKEHEEGLKKIKAAHEKSLNNIKSKSEELSKEQKIKSLTPELKEKYPTNADADKAISQFQKQLNTLYVLPADQRAKQKETLEENIKILKSIDYSVDPLMNERLWKEQKEIKDLLEIKNFLAEEQSERAKILAEEETKAKEQDVPQLSWWDRIKTKARDLKDWTNKEFEKIGL